MTVTMILRAFFICVVLNAALFLNFSASLRIVPKRMVLTATNVRYVDNATVHMAQGHNGHFIFHFSFTNKHTWNNNISVHIVYFEYLNKEFRRSFLEKHYRLCSMLQSDQYVGEPLRRAGFDCPVAPGPHAVSNISVTPLAFPAHAPLRRARLEFAVALTASDKHIVTGHIYLEFLNGNT